MELILTRNHRFSGTRGDPWTANNRLSVSDPCLIEDPCRGVATITSRPALADIGTEGAELGRSQAQGSRSGKCHCRLSSGSRVSGPLEGIYISLMVIFYSQFESNGVVERRLNIS